MEQGKRVCPACGSNAYTFRSRKQVTLPAPAVETKYRCKACGHEWREQVPKAT